MSAYDDYVAALEAIQPGKHAPPRRQESSFMQAVQTAADAFRPAEPSSAEQPPATAESPPTARPLNPLRSGADARELAIAFGLDHLRHHGDLSTFQPLALKYQRAVEERERRARVSRSLDAASLDAAVHLFTRGRS